MPQIYKSPSGEPLITHSDAESLRLTDSTRTLCTIKVLNRYFLVRISGIDKIRKAKHLNSLSNINVEFEILARIVEEYHA